MMVKAVVVMVERSFMDVMMIAGVVVMMLVVIIMIIVVVSQRASDITTPSQRCFNVRKVTLIQFAFSIFFTMVFCIAMLRSDEVLKLVSVIVVLINSNHDYKFIHVITYRFSRQSVSCKKDDGGCCPQYRGVPLNAKHATNRSPIRLLPLPPLRPTKCYAVPHRCSSSAKPGTEPAVHGKCSSCGRGSCGSGCRNSNCHRNGDGNSLATRS